MAVKLIEGFDHMSTVALFNTKGWIQTLTNTSIGAGSSVASSLVAGRISGSAYRITNQQVPSGGGGVAKLNKSLPAAYTGFVGGFAFRFGSTPASQTRVFGFTVGGGNTVVVAITSAAKIRILNSGGTNIATGTTVLSTGSWYYIEVKGVINGASGSAEVKLNGAAEIATTTGNFGSTGIDGLGPHLPDLTEYAGLGTLDFDDIYFLDTSASPNNNFLGDVAVETTYPSGAGAHTQWTPDSGSNYARVNEHAGTYPDDDTSFVSDSTVGHYDTYACTDLAILSGTVYAVQTNLYARKDNSGTRQIAAVARPGSTDRDGATVTLATSYGVFSEIRETNPDTSAAWVISEVNASEFGVKMVA